MERSHFLVAIVSMVSIIGTQSVHAEELPTVQQSPATTVAEWLAQSPVIQVTKVELNPTSEGLQVKPKFAKYPNALSPSIRDRLIYYFLSTFNP